MFGSGSPAQAEREVDAELIADSISETSEASRQRVPTVLILVLGNRDVRYAQSMISRNYDLQVHVWMWKSSAPGGYQEDIGDLVQVHMLDDIIQNLSFHGTTEPSSDSAEELPEGEAGPAGVDGDARGILRGSATAPLRSSNYHDVIGGDTVTTCRHADTVTQTKKRSSLIHAAHH